MIRFMSSDLEKLAEFYANVGDDDLSSILRGAAGVSRRRKRPEHIIDGFIVSTPLSQESEEKIERDKYFQIQNTILDIFNRVVPQRDRKYSREEVLAGLEQFNKEYGKDIPGNVCIGYFLMPGIFSSWLSLEQGRQIKSKIDKTDEVFRMAWNRMVRRLTIHYGNLEHIGNIRSKSEDELREIRNFGSNAYDLFHTAFVL